MSESIFAPPEANVETRPANEQAYYVVSPIKFYLLATLTLNIYFVYWFYRNWRLIKQREDNDTWPPMRGLFYIFFTHSLLTDVDETLKARGITYDWAPMGIATLFVVLTVTVNILDRMAGESIGGPIKDLVGTALLLVAPAILLRGQRAMNVACDDPAGETNARFTLANWAWMVPGGLIWLLAIFGLYAMFFAPEWLA
ncbi:MAG: hypothetical protein KJO82_16280 [Gammaproteobacteria bacterium]|nr:hypothetical protein [Gammaproteobacteria bacterium]